MPLFGSWLASQCMVRDQRGWTSTWLVLGSVGSITVISYGHSPRYTRPSSPSAQLTVTIAPSRRWKKSSPMPTMAGLALLTSNDCCVRGSATTTCDDGSCLMNHRQPGRSGFSVTRISPSGKISHFLWIRLPITRIRPMANHIANRGSGGKHFARWLRLVRIFEAPLPCWQQFQDGPAKPQDAFFIICPFNIHGHTIVLLNHHAATGKVKNLIVSKTEDLAELVRNRLCNGTKGGSHRALPWYQPAAALKMAYRHFQDQTWKQATHLAWHHHLRLSSP